MKKTILCMSVLLSLFGCGGGSNSDSSGLTEKTPNVGSSAEVYNVSCDTGVVIPQKLVGEWETDLNRNGSVGKQVIRFTSNCAFDSYEVGDHLIMDEWYGPLEQGKIYKFRSTPAQKISEINTDEFYLEATSGSGLITDYNTGENVVTWDMSSEGGYFDYAFQNQNTLIITYVYSPRYKLTYTYTRKDT